MDNKVFKVVDISHNENRRRKQETRLHSAANGRSGNSSFFNRKGCQMTNVWGFIDGTLMRTCRPKNDQVELFNGHKRYRRVKYQTVMVPNGMMVHILGKITAWVHLKQGN